MHWSVTAILVEVDEAAHKQDFKCRLSRGKKVYGASFHFLGGLETLASSVPAAATAGSTSTGASSVSASSVVAGSVAVDGSALSASEVSTLARFAVGLVGVVSERLLAVRFRLVLALLMGPSS